MDNFKDKVERWKELAELFLKNDERVYIKDIDDNFYFADITLVGDDSITVQCFSPEERKGRKFVLYWLLIKKFDKYNEKEEVVGSG